MRAAWVVACAAAAGLVMLLAAPAVVVRLLDSPRTLRGQATTTHTLVRTPHGSIMPQSSYPLPARMVGTVEIMVRASVFGVAGSPTAWEIVPTWRFLPAPELDAPLPEVRAQVSKMVLDAIVPGNARGVVPVDRRGMPTMHVWLVKPQPIRGVSTLAMFHDPRTRPIAWAAAAAIVSGLAVLAWMLWRAVIRPVMYLRRYRCPRCGYPGHRPPCAECGL